MKRFRLLPLLALSCMIFPLAQADDASIVIKPRPAKTTVLALPEFQPKSGNLDPAVDEYLKIVNETLWNDLEYSAFFKLLSRSFYPAQRIDEPEDLVFKDWQDQNLGVDFIVIGNARIESNYLVVQCRVFDLKTQEQVLGKQFRTIPRYTRAIAHRIADHIVSLLSANASQGIASTQIVFERKTRTGKEIYLADYDGANLQPITSNGSINVTPAWNPSNEWIAFTSYYESTPRLYLVSLANGQLQAFPPSGGLLTTPAFSPDGKQLAFAARLNDASDTDIYIADLDGGNLRNITQHPGIDISPCWSPTGRQLAFVSNRGGVPQIHICDTFGADLTCITLESGYASSPDWSPDGRYIVFSWKPSRMAHFDLFIAEVATKRILQLTQGNGDNENPSWAPDGRHIVFQSNRSGTSEIYTIFADGSELRQITNLQGCSNPDWSSYAQKN
ncbi:MAG: hypothetical protein GX414_16255 [Acidobacteria bacterium]|nr:hypothetical protein [Acidobacteriota bacterium]